MGAVADLTVAIGAEGGRVLLLKLMDIQPDGPPAVADMVAHASTSHDDRKSIVVVRAAPLLCTCAPEKSVFDACFGDRALLLAQAMAD